MAKKSIDDKADKKTTAKPTTAKKTTTKSATSKKTTTKKTEAKSSSAKKVATKVATSKKTTTKKTVAKSNAVKKATTSKKTTTKAATPKKIKAKATETKETTAKKTTAKKIAFKKSATQLTDLKSNKENNLTKNVVNDKSPISREEENSEFLDNFNWTSYAEGIEAIDNKQLDEFEKLVKDNFVDTSDEDVIEGKVVYMTDREAIIDINAKSEGVISLNEFRYNPELKVGDKVEVIVDTREDRTGQLVLSHRKARVIKAWDRVNNAHDNSEIVSGFVKCRTKGGMIVDVFGIEAFLPGSQIDVKPIRDYDQFVDKTMEFKD